MKKHKRDRLVVIPFSALYVNFGTYKGNSSPFIHKILLAFLKIG